MTSSPFPVVVLSDSESDDDDAALSRLAAESDDDDAALSRLAAESFSSSLATQAEVEALCKKHGVPAEFAARPAGERRACTPPPTGAVCVYAHALEAGLRFPLHDFISKTLSHFGLAPGQLTPNGWRVLLCFLVLCHSAGVTPSVALFRHFFSLKKRGMGWFYFGCKKGAGALVTGMTSPKSERDWKRAFFFLKSPDSWRCPVRWGEPPPEVSTTCPALSSLDNKLVTTLVHTYPAPVDLRACLSETNLAAALSSNLAGASPPPLLALRWSPDSTGSEGMDPTAAPAAAPAAKVKTEPLGDTPELSGKKRKHEDVGCAEDGVGRPEPNTPPAAQPGLHATPLSGRFVSGFPTPLGPDPEPRHMPVPDAHDGDSADWEEARKVLECIVTPSRERKFAVAKPSDVVASTYLAILQAANYASFSLGHALELEEQQTAQERDAAALREQLDEANAELTAMKQAGEAELEKVRAELAAARRATKAEVESAKTAAVQQFLESEEYTKRVAVQALAAYERGGEDMKRVALRLHPSLDAAKLVLPLD